MCTTPQVQASWLNSLAVTQNTLRLRRARAPMMFQFIYPEVPLLQTDFNVKELLRNSETFISNLSVKVMLTWLLLFERII